MNISPISSGPATNIRDQWMQLMITQMRNQNPMEPMSNNQMLSQMAQFATLEQMEGIGNSMSAMVMSQEIGYATSLIGHEVTFETDGESYQGTVTGAVMIDGDVRVRIDNEIAIDIGKIASIDS